MLDEPCPRAWKLLPVGARTRARKWTSTSMRARKQRGRGATRLKADVDGQLGASGGLRGRWRLRDSASPPGGRRAAEPGTWSAPARRRAARLELRVQTAAPRASLLHSTTTWRRASAGAGGRSWPAGRASSTRPKPAHCEPRPRYGGHRRQALPSKATCRSSRPDKTRGARIAQPARARARGRRVALAVAGRCAAVARAATGTTGTAIVAKPHALASASDVRAAPLQPAAQRIRWHVSTPNDTRGSPRQLIATGRARVRHDFMRGRARQAKR